MYRVDVTIHGEKVQDLEYAARVLLGKLGGLTIDAPDEKCKLDEEVPEFSLTGLVMVLPEYREGDLEKFIGCDPDFTGGLSTEEHLRRIRCGEDHS